MSTDKDIQVVCPECGGKHFEVYYDPEFHVVVVRCPVDSMTNMFGRGTQDLVPQTAAKEVVDL